MRHLLFIGIAFAAFQVSHSTTPDFCLMERDEGQGTSFVFSLYYDPIKDQCDPFIYRGEGGNGNRFDHERECIRNCSSKAEAIYPMDPSLACRLKKEKGKCDGAFLRYYYDAVHDKCKKFLWTGCIGNGNRFFDYNSCNATCAGIHEDGVEDEEDEPDTPIAIILGVLLAVIIAAIIITVVVLTVKSKKKGGKKKAGGKRDKSETPLQGQGIEMS